MGFTLTPRTRACADKAIVQALGKPWQVGARGPHSFDCWGFIAHVMQSTGVKVPDFQYEGKAEDRASLFDTGTALAVAQGFKRVPEKTPYSIVLLGKGGKITHVAIYHPSQVYYHSLERYGVVGHYHSFLAGLFDSFTYWGPA